MTRKFSGVGQGAVQGIITFFNIAFFDIATDFPGNNSWFSVKKNYIYGTDILYDHFGAAWYNFRGLLGWVFFVDKNLNQQWMYRFITLNSSLSDLLWTWWTATTQSWFHVNASSSYAGAPWSSLGQGADHPPHYLSSLSYYNMWKEHQ